MDVMQLLGQFADWQCTNQSPLTLEQAQFLLENEEHEAFCYDHSLYHSLMDYRDHLVEE